MSPDPWQWHPTGARRLEQAVSLIRLDGTDSLRFLHGQTSAAIEGSAAGSWIPTCCITATGRLRALAEVLVDAGGAWLLISSGDGTEVWQTLDRVLFPADRVQLGPVLSARLITPLGEGLDHLPHSPEGQWLALEQGQGWLLGRRLLLAQANLPLPQWLADRPTLSAEELERWRIQQGIPAAPGEVNADTNPFEAGLADRVSLNKGCYVGQETLAKLATYDGVKQQLRRWFWWAPRGAQETATAATRLTAGTTLIRTNDQAGEGEGAGSRAGQITSVLALDGGLWIGLAQVRRGALDEPQLSTGGESGAPVLQLSRPPAFVDPPVGAGRQS